MADLFGDWVIYRNMEPVDARLPGLRETWAEAGLPRYYVPRKTTAEYAGVLYRYLQQTQRLRGAEAPLERLLFVGDTPMNDGTAARNVGRYLPVLGFIAAEKMAEPARIDIQGELMLANRWEALRDFLSWVQASGFVIDEGTALLLDLDKTCLGARGRNDRLIDGARVQAILRTMRDLLDDELDETAFHAVYDPLNQPEYHFFTADNQDYLAYITLMIVGRCCAPEELWEGLESGRLAHFEDFVELCHGRCAAMSVGLRRAHDEVRHGLEVRDPTPFKAFRRAEYLETVSRMDVLPEGALPKDVLHSEIVLTAEVVDIANWMSQQGALVFGLSDKPDEAAMPDLERVAEGYRPLHHTPMKVYGNRLF
jgi:hypothetical protein